MNCSEVSLELEVNLAGELADQEAGEVKRHIDGCGNCKSALQSLEQLQAALKEVGKQPMPEHLQASITARCADQTRSRFPESGIKALMGASAAVLICLMICALFLRQQPVSAAEVLKRARKKRRPRGITLWAYRLQGDRLWSRQQTPQQQLRGLVSGAQFLHTAQHRHGRGVHPCLLRRCRHGA